MVKRSSKSAPKKSPPKRQVDATAQPKRSTSPKRVRKSSAKKTAGTAVEPSPPPLNAVPQRFLIVGMGASAGGLDAFQRFLVAMPANPGMAFVLVQHLDPDHDSVMPELLAKQTAMPVHRVTDHMRIEVNQVYVIPPNVTLTMERGELRVQAPVEAHGHRTPIDNFFCSLAADQGDCAVCVVLSGTGSDGTIGLTAVKEHGGMTMAQLPDSAQFDSMPRSATATGLVDDVLTVEEMPGKLLEYAAHFENLRKSGTAALVIQAGGNLQQICSVLHRKTGHDFSRYKRSTLVRRVQRRLQVKRVSSAGDYLKHLESDEEEARLLFQDLLIGVTHFFRDPSVFEVFEKEVLPALMHKPAQSQIRIWVPGCSSGEEAYTLAILVREAKLRADCNLPVNIFATDIDIQALNTARQAIYAEGIADHLSPERLRKFFTQIGSQYRVVKEIREMCIFSPHDLIKDPPFSRLDLISCRNVMIYLESNLQKKLFPVFHYALNPGGYLLLGPSESVPGDTDAFRTIDRKHRLFQSKNSASPATLTFPLMDVSKTRRQSQRLNRKAHGGRDEKMEHRIHRLLLDEYAPASVVIDPQGEIVYASGRTSRYLELPHGTPHLNVVTMVHKELRIALRTAIHRAISKNEEVVQANQTLFQDGHPSRLNVIVRPLQGEEGLSDLYLVVFQDCGPVVPGPARVSENEVVQNSGDSVVQLEAELQNAREFLESTIEELETSNEELKSSNEELLSLNEELQSSNEELQTSKEELQSVNEELQTVNSELTKSIEESDLINSDLQNLLQSTEIPTLFLDRNQLIRRFTPDVVEVFRMREGDVGRALADITARFRKSDLLTRIKTVLKNLERQEFEVYREDGDRWYLLRILPYRTVGDVIDGVVLTFNDISEQKHAREEIEKLNQDLRKWGTELSTILEVAPVGIAISDDLEGRTIRCNAYGSELLQMPVGENVSKSGRSGQRVAYQVYQGGQEVPADDLPMQVTCRTGEAVHSAEYQILRKDGTSFDMTMSALPLHEADGSLRGAVGAFQDVTNLRAAERRSRRRAAQQAAVAQLGTTALAKPSLDELLSIACRTISETLGNEFTKVLELREDRESLLLRAGVGWQPGLVGQAVIDTGLDSQAGYTLRVNEPVIVSNLQNEKRFHGPPLLLEHGVKSGISVVIGSYERPYGVLGTHSTKERQFSAEDADFMQAVAHILAEAIAIRRSDQLIYENHERLELLSQSTSDLLLADEPLSFLDNLYDRVSTALGIDVYFYYATTQAGEPMELVAHRGIPAAELKQLEQLSWGTAISGAVAQEFVYIQPKDMQSADQALTELIRSLGVSLYFCIPLLADNQLVGTLSFGSRKRTSFTADEIGLIRSIGNHLAVAIVKKRTEDALRSSEQRLIRLAESLEDQVLERTNLAERKSAQLRALANRLTTAERRERRRVSHLLHDHLQQLLVAVQMQIGIARHELADEVAMPLQKATEMIYQCLEASRNLTAELSPPVLQDASLAAALEWLSTNMLEVHGLDVELQLDEIPNLASDLNMSLFECTREVLFNVVKHSDVKSAVVRMQMLPRERVAIDIIDQGVGFDPVSLELAEGNERGFGLFSIRERLEFLGGELQIDSTPGEGTQIRLVTPIYSEMAEPENLSEPDASSMETPEEVRSDESSDQLPGILTRILVVDDHTILRQGLIYSLRRYPDIKVVGEAADGEQAIDKARRLHPDVILMDVTMPRVSGIEATQRIKQELPDIRILALSMHDEPAVATQMKQSGASAFLTKGSAVEEIVAKVRQLMTAD